MIRKRLTILAALLALALVPVGCGSSSSSSQNDVKDAANSFFNAIKSKDFAKACDLLSDRARAQLEALGKRLPKGQTSCAQVLAFSDRQGAFKGAPKGSSLDFKEVKVKGDTATVKTKGDTSPTTFKKVNGQWKVDIGQ